MILTLPFIRTTHLTLFAFILILPICSCVLSPPSYIITVSFWRLFHTMPYSVVFLSILVFHFLRPNSCTFIVSIFFHLLMSQLYPLPFIPTLFPPSILPLPKLSSLQFRPHFLSILVHDFVHLLSLAISLYTLFTRAGSTAWNTVFRYRYSKIPILNFRYRYFWVPIPIPKVCFRYFFRYFYIKRPVKEAALFWYKFLP